MLGPPSSVERWSVAPSMELLDDARNGVGSAIVVFGEPGNGKTALLEYLIASASATSNRSGEPPVVSPNTTPKASR